MPHPMVVATSNGPWASAGCRACRACCASSWMSEYCVHAWGAGCFSGGLLVVGLRSDECRAGEQAFSLGWGIEWELLPSAFGVP